MLIAREAWRLAWRCAHEADLSSARSFSVPDALMAAAARLLDLRSSADRWALCSAEAAPQLWPQCLRERWLLQRLALLAAHDAPRHARILSRYHRDTAPALPAVTVLCDDCGGHGETDAGCSYCGGTGSSDITCTGCDGCPHVTDDGECAHCEGRGYLYLSCISCGGLGERKIAAAWAPVARPATDRLLTAGGAHAL